MDRVFKKNKYTTSVVITLIFFSIVVASFIDSITCPMILQLSTEGSLAATLRSAEAAEAANNSLASNKMQMSPLMSKFLKLPSSVFEASYTYFPCNVTDLLLQIYSAWFLIFMFHKWITYKRAGWHYFMLDYCYFHNMLMIFMLISAIVSIDIHSPDGKVRNHRDSPSEAEDRSRHPNIGQNTTKPESLPGYWEVVGSLLYDGSESILTFDAARLYLGDPLRALIPSGVHRSMRAIEWLQGDTQHATSDTLAKTLDAMLSPLSSAPTTFATPLLAISKDDRDVPLPFEPTIRIRVSPARYALHTMPLHAQVRFVVIFIMFLGGTFGPILGAIVIWHNALLFHSFDKMTACYLHLAPTLVQIVIVSAVYETSDMVHQLRGLFNLATSGMPESLKPPMPTIMRRDPTDAKEIFAHYLTIQNILLSHVAFFCFWQIFYHITFSLLSLRRERVFAKKMKAQGKLQSLADCGTNPTARVTAYTWMMADPPGGTKGIMYRLVTCMGKGALPTQVLFSVVQLLFHLIYISASIPVLFLALKWREEPSWLLGYLSIFTILSINNAGEVMRKWISKLQVKAGMVNADTVRERRSK
eukprot:GILI01011241.1.p1 GENE.GILI01011241.1~~GILI01011241.1.p1  ORF type:complete len:586 (+),score=94.19 GILI01011241.1:56-1813(+)